MYGASGRRGAVYWRLLRPFRCRFSFSGLPRTSVWATSDIVYPNREQLSFVV